jgi:hypothetical protein
MNLWKIRIFLFLLYLPFKQRIDYYLQGRNIHFLKKDEICLLYEKTILKMDM